MRAAVFIIMIITCNWAAACPLDGAPPTDLRDATCSDVPCDAYDLDVDVDDFGEVYNELGGGRRLQGFAHHFGGLMMLTAWLRGAAYPYRCAVHRAHSDVHVVPGDLDSLHGSLDGVRGSGISFDLLCLAFPLARFSFSPPLVVSSYCRWVGDGRCLALQSCHGCYSCERPLPLSAAHCYRRGSDVPLSPVGRGFAAAPRAGARHRHPCAWIHGMLQCARFRSQPFSWLSPGHLPHPTSALAVMRGVESVRGPHVPLHEWSVPLRHLFTCIATIVAGWAGLPGEEGPSEGHQAYHRPTCSRPHACLRVGGRRTRRPNVRAPAQRTRRRYKAWLLIFLCSHHHLLAVKCGAWPPPTARPYWTTSAPSGSTAERPMKRAAAASVSPRFLVAWRGGTPPSVRPMPVVGHEQPLGVRRVPRCRPISCVRLGSTGRAPSPVLIACADPGSCPRVLVKRDSSLACRRGTPSSALYGNAACPYSQSPVPMGVRVTMLLPVAGQRVAIIFWERGRRRGEDHDSRSSALGTPCHCVWAPTRPPCCHRGAADHRCGSAGPTPRWRRTPCSRSPYRVGAGALKVLCGELPISVIHSTCLTSDGPCWCPMPVVQMHGPSESHTVARLEAADSARVVVTLGSPPVLDAALLHDACKQLYSPFEPRATVGLSVCEALCVVLLSGDTKVDLSVRLYGRSRWRAHYTHSPRSYGRQWRLQAAEGRSSVDRRRRSELITSLDSGVGRGGGAGLHIGGCSDGFWDGKVSCSRSRFPWATDLLTLSVGRVTHRSPLSSGPYIARASWDRVGAATHVAWDAHFGGNCLCNPGRRTRRAPAAASAVTANHLLAPPLVDASLKDELVDRPGCSLYGWRITRGAAVPPRSGASCAWLPGVLTAVGGVRWISDSRGFLSMERR